MKLKGLKVVVTGTFKEPRKTIEALLTKAGATVSSSVSSKTELLVCDEKAGSKLTKAESLGIKIINEKKLNTLMKKKSPTKKATKKASKQTTKKPAEAVTIGHARTIYEERKSDASLKKGEKTLTNILKPEHDAKPIESAFGNPDSDMLWLARLLVDAGAGTTKKKDKTLHLSEDTVFEGNLELKGQLLVTGNTLIIGDLSCNSIDIDESGSLAVAGNVATKSVACNGHFHVAKTLSSPLITGVDGGNLNATTVKTKLLLMWAYCAVNVDTFKGKKFNLEHEIEIGDAEYKQVEKLIVTSCIAKHEDDVDFGPGRIEIFKLNKLAEKGKAFLR